MKNIKYSARLLSLPLTLVAMAMFSGACSSSDPAPTNDESPKSPIQGIRFDWGVHKDEHDALQNAMSVLLSQDIESPSDQTLEKLKIKDAHPQTLLNWLKQRVHYIIPNGVDVGSRVSVQQDNYNYPNPGQLPVVETSPTPSSATTADTAGPQVVMLNTSGLIYVSGKTSGQLIGMDIHGVGIVDVTSPRSGILQIGDGLFSNQDYARGSVEEAIFQLGTLFHEARHSDGNKTSTAFIHAICPATSEYRGLYACDRSLNGPYTVGALITLDLANNCSDCTDEGRTKLKILALDYFNRILVKGAQVNTANGLVSMGDATDWDDQPEGDFSQFSDNSTTDDNPGTIAASIFNSPLATPEK